MKLLTVQLEATLDNEYGVHLHCTQPLEKEFSNAWVSLLFTWHRASFYGEALDVSPDKKSVRLTPEAAFDFLALRKEPAMMDIRKGDSLRSLEKRAGIVSALGTGDLQAQTSASEAEWSWHDALQRMRRSSLRTLPEQAITSVPFQLGLRLHEPINGTSTWKIETVATDKEDQQTILPADSHATQLPESWRAWYTPQLLNRMMDTLYAWTELSRHSYTHQLSDQAIAHFLEITVPTLLELDVPVFFPSGWKGTRAPQLAVELQPFAGEATSSIGADAYFQFDWSLAIEDGSIDEATFYQLVEEGRRLVRFQNEWLLIDPKALLKLQERMRHIKKSGVPLADLVAGKLTSQGDGDSFDDVELHLSASTPEHYRQFIQQLRGRTSPPVKLPSTFLGSLRTYQKQGVDWLAQLWQWGFGGCLADDMGLGKTVQVSAYFSYLKASSDDSAHHPFLLVVPASLLSHWANELERFAPSLRVHVHHGGKRNTVHFVQDVDAHYDVIITTYGLASRDQELFKQITWSVICVDEAQTIKNASTRQAKSVKRLPSRQKIALTGTPVENRMREIWSLMDLVNPGYLGTQTAFQQRFVVPYEKFGYDKRIQDLKALIHPFLLRRTKKGLPELALPEKKEHTIACKLSPVQAALYQQWADTAREAVSSETGIKRRGVLLAMMTKLKQICNHPGLVSSQYRQHQEGLSLKTDETLRLLSHIKKQNEHAILFTQFRTMGTMLQQVLQEQWGISIPFLHGGTVPSQRAAMIQAFQDGQHPLIILSLRAGGTGINLTRASHVIHYDRWWNPAVENQATDRAHRIGQTKEVYVHRMLVQGTLEERIDEVIQRKKKLQDDLLSFDSWLSNLSNEEFEELLF
ncbi:DEAD/DEAH box helicase [Aureibacillus halotolerans]|uniref:SNF2 family DNA or RNA helicase n=1 Tax=Aureibacillus halotolerans TaxID=1508390 RepID=A0A4R6TT03_9BACI|nr:DEAD/DEAH box helicase [Aureibacillus halotolerans]TDQ36451.1 SNF2 family DNA or RNA helicase [Aureibacillus halotolerans]